MTTRELPAGALSALSAAAAAGRAAWAKGDLCAAEAAFIEAWKAIPEPRAEYDYAQSIAWGMAVFYRDTGQFEKAYAWLKTVNDVYGDEGDPSVQFLSGTVAFDAGDEEAAFRLFDGLFAQFKARPFQGADPKYLAFYKQYKHRKAKLQ